MATPQEDRKQEEQQLQKFNEEQLAALETISSERPEKVLEAAERIGVLTDGTRAKIESEFPGHVLQFQVALSGEQSKEAPDKEAFLRAFKIIYGKFILEQTDPEMEKPEGVFMKTMKRVLRPESYGNAGDSPVIKSSKARLGLFFQSSRKSLQDKLDRLANLESDNILINDVLEVLSEKIDVVSDLQPSIDGLQNLDSSNSANAPYIKGRLNEVTMHIEYGLGGDLVEQVLPGMQLKCKSILDAINGFVHKPSDEIGVDEIKNIVKELSVFVSDLRTAIQPVKTQSDKGLAEFRNTVPESERQFKKARDHEERIGRIINSHLNERSDSIDQWDELAAQLSTLETEREYLNSDIAKYETSLRNLSTANIDHGLNNFTRFSATLKGSIENAQTNDELFEIVIKFEDLKEAIVNFENNNKLPRELSSLCDDYRSNYDVFFDNLERYPASSLTKENLRSFFDENVGSFFKKFKNILSGLKPSIKQKLEDVKNEVSQIDTEIKNLEAESTKKSESIEDFNDKISTAESEQKTIQARILSLDSRISSLFHEDFLEKAFPQVDPAEKRRAKRVAKKTSQLVDDADKAQDYLDEPGIKGSIQTAYDAFISFKSDVDLNNDFNDAPDTGSDLYKANLKTTIRGLMRGNGEEKRLGDELKTVQKKAVILQKSMKDFVKYLSVLLKLEIVAKPENAQRSPEQIALDYKQMDVNGPETTLEDLDDFAEDLLKYFKKIKFEKLDQNFATGVPKLQKIADKAKARFDELDEADKKQHLSEAQASKQVVTSVLKESYPNMNDEELQHLATLILTDDIETIQTLDSYEKLAEKGNAELYKAVKQAGFEDLLIGMELKEAGSEKVDRPFSGFKPEDLTDIDRLEELIRNKRMALKNGFIVLAAYENLHEGTTNLQAIRLAKVLKERLAKELGAAEHMTVSEVNAEVYKAFAEMKTDGKGTYDAYSAHYDENKPQWEASKVGQLEEDFKHLVERHIRGDVSDDKFRQEKVTLLNKAREDGVEGKVSFAQDSAMAGFYQGSESKWIRDLPHKIGQYAKTKGLASLKESGLLAAKFAGGALGTGFRAGKYALDKPFRYLAKYPFMLGAKAALFLPRTIFNFFSPKKWNAPYQGMKARWDADRQAATGYRKNILAGITGRTGNAIKSTISGVAGAKAEYKPFAERSGFDLEASKERAKGFEEKAKKTPAEMPVSARVDLGEYMTKIAELIKVAA